MKWTTTYFTSSTFLEMNIGKYQSYGILSRLERGIRVRYFTSECTYSKLIKLLLETKNLFFFLSYIFLMSSEKLFIYRAVSRTFL